MLCLIIILRAFQVELEIKIMRIIVWKDIIRFHAIFWPAMLASYFDLWKQGSDGVIHYNDADKQKLPETILTWGFFTVDGQKMSKSLGNVIEPVSYSEQYSQELLTLYMLSAFPIWNDGNYDRQEAIKTYNAKLANNLWNLVNRVVVLSLKLSEKSGQLDCNTCSDISFQSFSHLYEKYDLKSVLDSVFQELDILNKYADDTQPWKTIKDQTEATRQVLFNLAEWLRQVWLTLYPFFPEKMLEMFEKLWLEDYKEQLSNWKLGELLNKKEKFKITEKWDMLFKSLIKLNSSFFACASRNYPLVWLLLYSEVNIGMYVEQSMYKRSSAYLYPRVYSSVDLHLFFKS